MMELPEEDSQFLEEATSKLRDSEFNAVYQELRRRAAGGDSYVQDELEIFSLSEEIQGKFDNESQKMMDMTVAVLHEFVPGLMVFIKGDIQFFANFALAMRVIHRDAYTRGWWARGKEDVRG